MRLLGAGLLIAVRGLHVSSRCSAIDKQLLSKLRKTTGFPFVNCRKALEKFGNDITQAEKWLREQAQKEGWAKATKLQGRPMSQGLIGVIVKDRSAAMVEVNCETDFVARNAKFSSFVSLITDSFLQHSSTTGQNKILLDSTGFSTLLVDHQQQGKVSVGDLTALEVGNIGENILVRRGVFLQATSPSHSISSYVHVTGPPLQHSTGSRSVHHAFQAGKYGALLLYSATGEVSQTAGGDSVEVVSPAQLGRSLCQHIVGMNPLVIGTYREEKKSEDAVDKVEDRAGVEVSDQQPVGEEETELLRQEYMLDTTQTVGEVVRQHGLEILDFVRLECGAEDDVRLAEQQQQSRTEKSASVA